ncbi:MAG: hypothetical protein M3Q45_00105 [Chloroflexota bacterium]|nr:hypothetical protein [Chloroflexota bacterium]
MIEQKVKPKLDAKLIRAWAKEYQLINRSELERRREAVHQNLEKKLAGFFDLCETVLEIAPPMTQAQYQSQLRAHLVERERMLMFEERRTHGKKVANGVTSSGAVSEA